MIDQQQDTHPPGQTLVAFALGQLEGGEAARLADHLGACARCLQAAQAVPGGSLPALLQSASTPVPRPDLLAATAAAFEKQLPPELLAHERYRVLQRLGAGAWAWSTRPSIASWTGPWPSR
jgi:anti-sigma factor ChrR (cupin superfamily)